MPPVNGQHPECCQKRSFLTQRHAPVKPDLPRNCSVSPESAPASSLNSSRRSASESGPQSPSRFEVAISRRTSALRLTPARCRLQYRPRFRYRLRGAGRLARSSGPRMKLPVNLFQPFARDMSIDLRGGNVGMSEHQLHRAEVGAVCEQVRGKGMPEHVR